MTLAFTISFIRCGNEPIVLFCRKNMYPLLPQPFPHELDLMLKSKVLLGDRLIVHKPFFDG